MTTKSIWSKKVPSEEGWYWVTYKGKRGKIVCPALLLHFPSEREASKAGWCVHTAKNDFFRHDQQEDLKFGSVIEPPEEKPVQFKSLINRNQNVAKTKPFLSTCHLYCKNS